MLRDAYGRNHVVKRAEAKDYLFKYCNILEPLRALKDIAELVKIRGDLPQAYTDDLTKTLSASNLSVKIKKQQNEEKAVREAQHKAPSFQEFMAGISEKNKDDLASAGMVKLARQCMNVTAKSPAVMRELMKPPTEAEM